jgi:large subunit ribosomal protein L19
MDKLKLIKDKIPKKEFPNFQIGDTVKVLVKIAEGDDKTRLHPFEGVIIASRGSGITGTFTVRKVSYGEGIERVFQLHSPNIERIELVRSGKVKRAKLYYLRAKIGKRATKIQTQEAKP